jgi:hypothetical protein
MKKTKAFICIPPSTDVQSSTSYYTQSYSVPYPSHTLQTTWIIKINTWGRREEATAVCTSQHTTRMSQATVFWWWKHFTDGNKRVVDDAWNERPSTDVTDDNGYLGSKLWMAFTMRIQLKLTYGMLFRKTGEKKKRPEFLAEQWFLLQGNAWAHTTLWRQVLADISWMHAEYPPYHPGFTLCDFWAFPKLKYNLWGQKFSTHTEVIHTTTTTTTQYKMYRKGLLHMF